MTRINSPAVQVSTRSRPKAAGGEGVAGGFALVVSTRSRPKAAGRKPGRAFRYLLRFNTQPPEGGWGAPGG